MKSLHTFLALLCAFCGQSIAADTKPNIIFILADDIGLPGFGCTGGVYKTPNIDALAAGGTRFGIASPRRCALRRARC